MNIRVSLVALCAIASSCGSGAGQGQALPSASTSSPSLKESTLAQLKQKLDACTPFACDEQPILKELWARGYCKTAAQGTIRTCTSEEVIDDRETSAALGNTR